MNFSARVGLLALFSAPALLLLLWPAPGRSLNQPPSQSSTQSPLPFLSAPSPYLPQPARGGTRGPVALLFGGDGRQLYVAEQDENDVAVVDAESGRVAAHIGSGGEQPTAMALAPDGRVLVVANAFSGTVGIVDTEKQTLRAQAALRGEPSGVAITPDGRAWVSVAQLDEVAVIDLASAKVTQRIAVGHCPRVLALTPDGKTLLCANSLGGSLSLLDVAQARERGRIALPALNLRGMAFSPDGAHVYVTGQQPHNDLPTERAEAMWSNVICDVRLDAPASDIAAPAPLSDIAAPTPQEAGALNKEESGEGNRSGENSPEGNRPRGAAKNGRKTGGKNRTPEGIGGIAERLLVLDLPTYGAADPRSIALDAAGETAYVTLSGTHEVALVPLHASVPTSRATADATDSAPQTAAARVPKSQETARHGAPTGKADKSDPKSDPKIVFKSDGGDVNPRMVTLDVGALTRRVHVGCNPRALALRPHSAEVWVANHLSNSLYALPDLIHNAGDNSPAAPLQKVGRVADLGTPTPSPNRRLRGRFFFASAHVTRSQFFSCESCHPNGGTDGLSWRFAHVKDGLDARNTKDLRGMLLLTAPYGWGGREEDFEAFVHDEVGGLLHTRKLEHPEVHALWDLVNETPLAPNPYRNADGALTQEAERGRILFNGQGKCVTCHVGEMHGGTTRREWIGTTPQNVTLDVPHLAGAYDSAPYLHDGRAATLEEVFTKCNPAHLHGGAHTLSKAQLHDLVEYVKQL